MSLNIVSYPYFLRARVRRQLRRVTPSDAHRILGQDRYWTVPFFDGYLELCDETMFHVPQDGYTLARLAPELADRIPSDIERFGFPSAAEKASTRVRALGVFASSCRASGRLSEADEIYLRAFEKAEETSVSPEARIDLQLRYSILLTVRKDPGAFALADEAVAFYEKRGRILDLACALVIRGAIRTHLRPEVGLPDYLEACSLGYPAKGRCQRAYLSALTNSLFEIAQIRGLGLDTLRRVLQDTKRAQRNFGKPGLTVPKTTLLWIEGMLNARIGATRLAERQLEKVRAQFRTLEEPIDLLIASADLALLYRREGEEQKLAKLYSEVQDDLGQYADTVDLERVAIVWRRVLPAPSDTELRELRTEVMTFRA